MVRPIQVTYTGTKAKVLSPDGEIEQFEILALLLHSSFISIHNCARLHSQESSKYKREKTRTPTQTEAEQMNRS